MYEPRDLPSPNVFSDNNKYKWIEQCWSVFMPRWLAYVHPKRTQNIEKLKTFTNEIVNKVKHVNDLWQRQRWASQIFTAQCATLRTHFFFFSFSSFQFTILFGLIMPIASKEKQQNRLPMTPYTMKSFTLWLRSNVMSTIKWSRSRLCKICPNKLGRSVTSCNWSCFYLIRSFCELWWHEKCEIHHDPCLRKNIQFSDEKQNYSN